jgi:hypothetical protein
MLCAVLGACQAALAKSTLIKDVRVFDGQAVHEHRSVLFDKGVIVDADFRAAAPQGAGVIEGAGRTLLPGLIDAHTHAFRWQELPVLFGVTTQIDMFIDLKLIEGWKSGPAHRTRCRNASGKCCAWRGRTQQRRHRAPGPPVREHVRNYLSEAISKLGAANRIEACRMARDAGWL